MDAPTFNVTRVNKIASKKRLLVSDRTDLNMNAQRCNAFKFCRDNLLQALVSDYNATVASRGTHHEFLVMMLNEVHRYHKNTFNVVLPRRALEILADKVAVEMIEKENHYGNCLDFLCRFRLYSVGFQNTATQMVALDNKNHNKTIRSSSFASAGSSSSSCGLSDDGAH